MSWDMSVGVPGEGKCGGGSSSELSREILNWDRILGG